MLLALERSDCNTMRGSLSGTFAVTPPQATHEGLIHEHMAHGTLKKLAREVLDALDTNELALPE